MIFSKTPDSQKSSLYKLLYDLWESGEDVTDKTKEYYDYWDGKLSKKHASAFTDQTKTTTNVIKEIIECKLDNMLDAQFTLSVVPVLNSFADYNSIRDMKDVADVYNDSMHQVLKDNNWDSLKERVARWGLICGHGIGQTYLSTDENVEGDIKITDIEPKVRWNKGAKKWEELSFIAYETELNQYICKKMFAYKDGQWDDDLCEQIDDITEIISDDKKGQQKGVVNVQTDTLTQQAYAYDNKGINTGKIVKLIVMFLLDDTLYSPEKSDSDQEAADKQEFQKKYPNGRVLVFSQKRKSEIILEDKAAPKGFKGLGNIDIFNPIDFGELKGKGEVEDLKPVQDRINGARIKQRGLISDFIKTIGLDKAQEVVLGENDMVANPVSFLEGIAGDAGKAWTVLTNDTLSDIKALESHIMDLKRDAYAQARVNETMIAGLQPKGVTSGDQLDALQESPMSTIRKLQRNFKDFVTRVGQKVIMLIQENYTTDRLIGLSTGINVNGQAINTARISTNTSPDEQGQDTSTKTVELLNEAGQAVKTIKINPDWKFNVEVAAGTEIPRTRREAAMEISKLVAAKVLDLSNPDDLAIYVDSIDLPNGRALVSQKRNQQKMLASQKPTMPKMEDILKSKDQSMAVAAMLTAISNAGFSQADAQLLTGMGVIGTPNTIATVPVDKITSRSQVQQVATISPSKISDDPETAKIENAAATKLQLIDHGIVQ
jgi:hypothetical protein